MRPFIQVSALIIALTGAALASAPSETERPGRYTMQPIEGGFLRMDTATGDVSLCARVGPTAACEPVKDDRDLQKELARLTSENKALKADIMRLEELLDLRGKTDSPPSDRPASRGPKLGLPSEEDVDKALGYLERMFKKFRDKLNDLEGSRKGTQL